MSGHHWVLKPHFNASENDSITLHQYEKYNVWT